VAGTAPGDWDAGGPGGGPVHGILPHEIDAILEVAERRGPIDRVHR